MAWSREDFGLSIDDQARRLGFVPPKVRPKFSGPITLNDGVGKRQDYSNGFSIFWHPRFGAYAVGNSILGAYYERGAELSPRGYPVTNTFCFNVDIYNYFQRGMLIANKFNHDYRDVRYVDMRERRYNHVRQLSSHNAYHEKAPLLNQLIYHRIHSLELDLHDDGLKRDWNVYHVTDGASCDPLSQCFKQLRAFHDTNPEHEVVTIWLQVSSSISGSTIWGSENNHCPIDLDILILQHFLDCTYTPRSIKRDFNTGLSGSELERITLQEALRLSGEKWPTLESLKGKFIFVLHGDYGELDDYLDSTDENRVAFVAPEVVSLDEGLPNDDVHNNSIFFNIPHQGEDKFSCIAWPLWQRGFVTRVYGVDSQEAYEDARACHINHLATDNIDFHRVHRPETFGCYLYPFENVAEEPTCDKNGVGITDSAYADRVNENFILMESVKGAMFGKKPSFLFLPHNVDSSQKNNLTANVVGRGRYSSGCSAGALMARASLEPNSAYVAVCRPADMKGIYMRCRYPSGHVETFDATLPDVDNSKSDTYCRNSMNCLNPMFLRLELSLASKRAIAYASALGTSPSDWKEIGSMQLNPGDERFNFIGLAVNGSRASSRFIFQNVRLNDKLLDRVSCFDTPAVISRDASKADFNYRVVDNCNDVDLSTILPSTTLPPTGRIMIGNRRSGQIHALNCEFASQISPRNRFNIGNMEQLQNLLAQGYDGCYYCLREYHTW